MNQYTNLDIQTKTGLSRNFINKANSKLHDILKPFRITADSNKILYNDDGLRIWDVIKQEKEKGANIPHIRKVLLEIYDPSRQGADSPDKTDKASTESPQTPRQNGGIDLVVNALRDAYQIALKEMGGKVALLEEGREKQKEREDALQTEITTLKQTVWTEQQKREQRQLLYARLSELDGKWGRSKERQAIRKQLEGLDAL